jgi:hypothetical protein
MTDTALPDGRRLATFVTMLLGGIIALAAADPASIGHAVETAKWAAAGRLGQPRQGRYTTVR